MNERDQQFAAAARDWLNTVADEQVADEKMRLARAEAERLKEKRAELEATLSGFVGLNLRTRAASCGSWTVLVESENPLAAARVRKIPTIKAGVDAP